MYQLWQRLGPCSRTEMTSPPTPGGHRFPMEERELPLWEFKGHDIDLFLFCSVRVLGDTVLTIAPGSPSLEHEGWATETGPLENWELSGSLNHEWGSATPPVFSFSLWEGEREKQRVLGCTLFLPFTRAGPKRPLVELYAASINSAFCASLKLESFSHRSISPGTASPIM